MNFIKDTGLWKQYKEPRNQQSYEIRLRLEEEIGEEKGDSYKIIPQNVNYNFHWRAPSKDYSCLYNYSRNIREDWLAPLKECEQMMIEKAIIQNECEMKEVEEEQSGGMKMGQRTNISSSR